MEQHPVPQQISTYQFRLIGDMTLRQFSQLAGGALIAFLFYSLPLNPFVKWFLVLFFGFLGFALAFLPIEDRPLDKWIVAFFKSVYSATQFIWQQEHKVPDFMLERPKKEVLEQLKKTTEIADVSQVTQYLETLPVTLPETAIERAEILALEKIDALFQTLHLPGTVKPEIKKMAEEAEDALPEIKVKPRKLVVPPSESVNINAALLDHYGADWQPGQTPEKQKLIQPKFEPLRFKVRRGKKKDSVEATTSTELPIPVRPSQPNVVVGMVLDPQGKIIEKAIIEIREAGGLPVRALRTNRLGQFQIVTPLGNGTYEIEVEKDGFKFDIIKITLSGKIVEPLKIKAK